MVLRLISYLAVVYLAVGGFFWLRQESILFPAPPNPGALTPANSGIAFEDLHIPVGSGGSIHAWWIPAASPASKTGLFFHGNGYTLEYMLDSEIPALRGLGLNLLLVDYRGYGGSSPIRPNESTIFQDADAAFAHLTERRQIPAGKIVAVGRSIGSGPAVYLAERHAAIGGLILESPFTSIHDAARGVSYLRIFPLSLMLRTHFNNLSRIGSVRAPVFIATGSADTLTPPAMAERLFARANQPKHLLIVPRADHDDLIGTGGDILQNALRKFLQ
jgi:fermentation-respiration switch protein FrsA (DUF1100 family)